MSKVYELKFVQRLPVSMDKAWDFFSNPANLQAITPSKMGFSIISKHHGDKMYAGQIIEYKVNISQNKGRVGLEYISPLILFSFHFCRK